MLEKFNQYYLTETLSKKYSHVTYLASPINEPEHQVVLIVFSSSLFRFPHERESLLQKAQHMKKIQHEQLVPILDIGIEEEQPFVVREYLPNGSLRRRLKQLSPGRLQLREALNIISQVGEALAYAQKHNIVHGNIKPENIFLDANGRAFLADFQLVSRKDASIRDQTSEEYAFCYLAPEQFAGITDAWSDQYALGCLSYELITGRVPFAAQSLASMMGQPSNALPTPLSESVADLPPSLEAAVLKALAKDPTERFFDFSLFLEVIKSVLSPPPDFPLAHAMSSRKNRTASRSVRSTKAKNIVSPINKRTTSPNLVSESPELSSVTSNTDFGAEAPVGVYPMPQIDTHEKMDYHPHSESLASPDLSSQIPFPFPGEAHPLGGRDKEEEVNDHLFKDNSFTREYNVMKSIASVKEDMQEEADALPVIVAENSGCQYSEYAGSESSIHQYKEDAVAEETLLLTRNSDGDGLRVRRGGRRVLRLLLLVSVVMALIVYVIWPLVATTHDTGLQTTNKTQGVIPQVTSVSMEQVPLPATAIVTAQPSVTDTPTASPPVINGPTVQPVVTVPVRNIPSVGSPKPAPKPAPTSAPKPASTPTPTPTVTATNTAINYEAELSQNTLNSGAKIISCSSCSGGYRVGYLGLRSNGYSGTLQFNNVKKASAGTYTLTLYYSNGSNSDQYEYISVNGGSPIVFDGTPTGSFSTFTTAAIAIPLNGGNNTIEFYNPNNAAPDIDRIIV